MKIHLTESNLTISPIISPIILKIAFIFSSAVTDVLNMCSCTMYMCFVSIFEYYIHLKEGGDVCNCVELRLFFSIFTYCCCHLSFIHVWIWFTKSFWPMNQPRKTFYWHPIMFYDSFDFLFYHIFSFLWFRVPLWLLIKSNGCKCSVHHSNNNDFELGERHQS